MCDHCGCRQLTPVARLMAEHDRLRELTGQVRLALSPSTGSAAWPDGVLRLLADLDEHLFEDHFALFPAALAVLDGADWDRMDQETTHSPGAAAGTPA